MSATLIDDQILVLSGRELIQANRAVQWYIAEQKRRNGAAPMIGWAPMLRRGANVTKDAMFVDEPRTRTLQVIEAGSEPDDVDRSQEITAVEAAKILGISPQHCRRIRLEIGTLRERPIRFSRDAVIAYKMHRDTERSTA